MRWEWFETAKRDFSAVRERDPSVPRGITGVLETVFCTPGYLAVLMHRGVHFLHATLRIPVLPRFLSLVARWVTGIEIHPGARLGRGLFIDHGMGVVIGESAVIGDDVTLYHGVTLGATGNERTWKRHPTLESGVIVGSGARILGPVTIGRNARVGAGSVVLKDVEAGTTVTGAAAEIVKTDGRRVSRTLERQAEAIRTLEDRIGELEKTLEDPGYTALNKDTTETSAGMEVVLNAAANG